MKNINKITNKIKYENFFIKLPSLNQLNNGNFNIYLLTDNNFLLKIVYIGSINNFSFFIPIELNQLSEFVIFNKNVKSYKNTMSFFSIFNIKIYKTCILFTTSFKYIKKTNNILSPYEKNMFLNTLSDLNNIDFIKILETYSKR